MCKVGERKGELCYDSRLLYPCGWLKMESSPLKTTSQYRYDFLF